MPSLRHGLHALYLIFVLASCAPSVLREAEEAKRAGAYYRAEQFYKRLYASTPRKKAGDKGRFAYEAGIAALEARRYATALNLLKAAERLHIPDSLLREPLERVRLSTEPAPVSEEARTSPYEVCPFEPLRSAYSDYGVTYSADGKTLIFGSNRRRYGAKTDDSPVTGEPLGALYSLSQRADGSWAVRPDSLKGLSRPRVELGAPSLSPDGRRLYYSMVGFDRGKRNVPKIYVSGQGERGEWREGRELRLFADSTILVAHPSVSPSGHVLFFVSDAPGGRGGKDLYQVRLDGGRVGEPFPLGAQVNTSGDELYPYAVSDSILYFSSDRPGGLGGLDIYRAVLSPEGVYQVTPLPAPINSPSDDLAFAPSPVPDAWPRGEGEDLAEVGLFASARDDARGLPHLYEFRRAKVTTTIEGLVLDREGEPIRGATIHLVGNHAEEMERVVTTDGDGAFRLPARSAMEYVMLASAPNYLNQYVRLSTDPSQESETYSVDFYLASRVAVEQLREVHYAFDRAEVLPESEPALRMLYKLLTDNPEVSIRLLSHTDRHGPAGYNLRLSQRRAEAVLRYLTELGIAPERLRAEGYGKSRPYVVSRRTAEAYPFLPAGSALTEDFIARLSSPEEQAVCDQLNRRTEFQVLDSE